MPDILRIPFYLSKQFIPKFSGDFAPRDLLADAVKAITNRYGGAEEIARRHASNAANAFRPLGSKTALYIHQLPFRQRLNFYAAQNPWLREATHIPFNLVYWQNKGTWHSAITFQGQYSSLNAAFRQDFHDTRDIGLRNLGSGLDNALDTNQLTRHVGVWLRRGDDELIPIATGRDLPPAFRPMNGFRHESSPFMSVEQGGDCHLFLIIISQLLARLSSPEIRGEILSIGDQAAIFPHGKTVVLRLTLLVLAPQARK